MPITMLCNFPSLSVNVNGFDVYEWNLVADLNGGAMNPWGVVTSIIGGTFSPWSEVAVVDGGTLGGYEPDLLERQALSVNEL